MDTTGQGWVCPDILKKCLKLFLTERPLIKYSVAAVNKLKSNAFSFLLSPDIGYKNSKEIIPDYDRITKPPQLPKNFLLFHHGDIEVYSRLLRLRVSFQWRPLINETVFETLRLWVPNNFGTPNLLFLGIEVYHMLNENGADFFLYNKKIIEISQILEQLSNLTQVIWLNQYPVLEGYGPNNAHNVDIHSEKVNHYNEAVRQILRCSYNQIFSYILSFVSVFFSKNNKSKM
ncbi:hypothetical protein OUZ56_011797 [Daphnia magna]|uniref:Uncharacterized protein n=1 Tax=Daphnia magna TaxID=35525 RepID=A0ABQ9Z1D2_9CRUS|nr:hypothetical protein OUZ56_011797 [Daphnia magna]